MKKIYIEQEAIKINARRGEGSDKPVVVETVKDGLPNIERYWCLDIEGPCKIHYDPFASGPRVYITTESPVVDPLAGC